MSPDDIDSLIVSVVHQVEKDVGDPDLYNDDGMFERLSQIFYDHLEKHCTRDRNYN